MVVTLVLRIEAPCCPCVFVSQALALYAAGSKIGFD